MRISCNATRRRAAVTPWHLPTGDLSVVGVVEGDGRRWTRRRVELVPTELPVGYHGLEVELSRYLAHGLLHLLGHDHQGKGEAAKMARAEAALLGRAGMLG